MWIVRSQVNISRVVTLPDTDAFKDHAILYIGSGWPWNRCAVEIHALLYAAASSGRCGLAEHAAFGPTQSLKSFACDLGAYDGLACVVPFCSVSAHV